jgi:microcystin-dependent protein
MPGPVTTHYGWQLPLPGGDPTIWGTEINTVFGQVDGQVWANQQAIAANGTSVGDMKMFAGPTPPTNWAICDGSSQSTTGPMAALFAVIGYAYGGSSGSFNLPNAKDKVIVGAGGLYALGATGGEATHLLATTELPAHAHPITEPSHTHTATQAAHTHGDAGHSHAASASDSGHTHGYQNTGTGHAGLTAGGAFGGNFADNTAVGYANVSVSIGTGYASLNNAQPAITVAATTVGLTTTNNAGGGLAHNNMQPFLAINMIIRYA